MKLDENNSIILNELGEVSKDFLEIGIDSLIKDGALKDIPIVGSIFSLAKVGYSIKDQILLKKICLFLFELKEISDLDKNQFIHKIDTDNNYKKKVSESLLLILDKFNDYNKAEMLGKLFAAAIKGEIDYKMFSKLSHIIDRAYFEDLKVLVSIYNNGITLYEYDELDELYSIGVLTNLGISGDIFLHDQDDKVPNTKNEFEINIYGKKIVELIFQ
ncbi:hypothetical protein [Flavobacterium humi]|uniref:DUF4393 domain-containing protein n=1 Tax=Flavobacterium humi TaxID=2562683 RepID=A0A4Z0L903_9FLAO|nr:hypothetical protein [Flavobacterium humi]TGD58254.1 hypothetical protein E4635_09620 [Flavobacterium humi]